MLGLTVFVAFIAFTTAQTTQQTVASGLRTSFNRVDTNGDGKITYSEMNASLQIVDTDNNGKVIFREYAVASTTQNRALAEKIFNYYDYDADGHLDEDDLFVAFQELDVNRDHGISFEEYSAEGTTLLALLLPDVLPSDKPIIG